MRVRFRFSMAAIALASVAFAAGPASAHPIASGSGKLPFVGIVGVWVRPEVKCNASAVPAFDGTDGGIKDVSGHAGVTGVRITADITNLPTQPASDAATVDFYTTGCVKVGATVAVNGTRTGVTIPSSAKWMVISPLLLSRILTSYSVTH